MASKIVIQHRESGLLKSGYYGFSWTYFFFGFFVPVFRGELGVGALHLLFTVFTLGIWQIIMCFIYNKQYMTRMLTGGWRLAGSESENNLAEMALKISDVALGKSTTKQLTENGLEPILNELNTHHEMDYKSSKQDR